MTSHYSQYAMLINAAHIKGADKWEKAEKIAREISRAICIKHVPQSLLIDTLQRKESVAYQTNNRKESISSLLFEAEIFRSNSHLIRIKQELDIVFSFSEGNLFIDFKLQKLIIEKNFYNHIALQCNYDYFFPATKLADQYLESFIPCEELSKEENEALIDKAKEAFWDYMEALCVAMLQYKLANEKIVTFIDGWMQKWK